MYREHFDLAAEPFALSPDPENLYLAAGHREALAALRYGILHRRGFVTLVGEVGTGKTSLVYELLRSMGSEVQTAYLAYPVQCFENLLSALLEDLGVCPVTRTKADMLDALNAHLTRQADEGRTVALVLDEAQDLSDDALEELRLLSNFETYSEKLVQIVLVGQPELAERLRQPKLRQLRERVAVRAAIFPLSRAEMARYVEHRLERAGGSSKRLFTRSALRLIVRCSAGIPRRANILCNNALLFAYGRGLACVNARVAREAIAEMTEDASGLRGLRRKLALVWMTVPLKAVGMAAGAVVVVSGAALMGRFFGVMPTIASLPSDASSPVTTAVASVADERMEAVMPGQKAEPVVTSQPAEKAEPAVASVTAPSNALPPTANEGQVAVVETPPPVAPAAVAALPKPTAPKPASDAPPTKTVTRAPKKSDSAKGATTSKAVRKEDPLTVTLPAGTTLFSVLRSTYEPPLKVAELYAEIRRLNPEVKDVNHIPAGTVLRLPRRNHEQVLR